MRKQETSQHRAPCHLRGRMNLAAAGGAADGGAAGEVDAVGEVEDPDTGRTWYWVQEIDNYWGKAGWVRPVSRGRRRLRETLQNALRGHEDPGD